MNPQTTMKQSAQSVQQVLLDKGWEFKVVELPASTRTAREAADAIGCGVQQIVKSIIFKTTDSNTAVLVLVSGTNFVDEKRLTFLVGEDIEKADAKYTRKVTGYTIGGIPPVGHKQVITTLIDEDLISMDVLWAAAGTPNAVFRLNSNILVQLTGGKVACIKK